MAGCYPYRLILINKLRITVTIAIVTVMLEVRGVPEKLNK